jgi:GNAT superfamily N-acetyltransferase
MEMQLVIIKEPQRIAPLSNEVMVEVSVSMNNGERYKKMANDLITQGSLMEGENYATHWTWAILLEDEKVVVVLEADLNDPFMNLEEIYSFERGKGHASKAMKTVIEAADKWGVNMELDVEPFSYGVGDEEVLDGLQLERFYERFGFIKTEMDGIPYFHRLVEIPF